MPIAAASSPISSGINSAWSLGKGAQVNSTTQMFITTLSTTVTMGLYPMGISMIPLSPTGMSAAQGIMVAGLSMGKGAKVNTTSKQMAQAISVLAPICPPAGLSSLGSLIESAMSMGKGAKVNTVAQQISQAIVTYYQTGGTV